MLCPAAALVLLLHHHGQAAHVFVILAIPYLIGMPRIDLGACFAPSGCLLVVTTGSNRPIAVIQHSWKWPGAANRSPPLALFYEYGILGSCRPCTQSLATLTHSG